MMFASSLPAEVPPSIAPFLEGLPEYGRQISWWMILSGLLPTTKRLYRDLFSPSILP
jgi:hypothetical protein